MKMEKCNGGDPDNDFLLPFFDWDELNKEQKAEVKKTIGRWLGAGIREYRFGKGVYYGQNIWFAHKKGIET